MDHSWLLKGRKWAWPLGERQCAWGPQPRSARTLVMLGTWGPQRERTTVAEARKPQASAVVTVAVTAVTVSGATHILLCSERALDYATTHIS